MVMLLMKKEDIDRELKPIIDKWLTTPPILESRLKGKWIMDEGVGECSRCHWLITAGDEEINNYCPHCGSDMRGEE